MVIFADPRLIARLEAARSPNGDSSRAKTMIVPLELADSKYAGHFGAMQEMFAAGRIPKPGPKGGGPRSPTDIVRRWSKFHCLDWALRSPLCKDAEGFFWIDFDVLRRCVPPQPNECALRDVLLKEVHHRPDIARVWCTQIDTPGPFEKRLIDVWYARVRRSIAGAFFGGARAVMSWLVAAFDEEVLVVIDKARRPALEETMLGRIVALQPRRFIPCLRPLDGHPLALQPSLL
jgi:hypothetical protein